MFYQSDYRSFHLQLFLRNKIFDAREALIAAFALKYVEKRLLKRQKNYSMDLIRL